MQATKIIHKLQKQINKSGYIEDLGQKELLQYREYVFSKYPYKQAAVMYANLSSAIDEL